MKREFLRFGLLCMLAILSIRGMAQDTTRRPIPKWVSEKGYWQIENNINIPDNFTVYFFNNEGTMVYKERIEGVRLNLQKRKTLMRLKKALDQYVIAWENRLSPKSFISSTNGH